MPVAQFRVVFTPENFEQAVAFYPDELVLDPGDLWTDNGGHDQMIQARLATLKIFYPAYIKSVDQNVRSTTMWLLWSS